MKHLRTKLYVSVGSLFLLVAVLNYLLPEIFVKKEMAKASIHLKKEIDGIQQKLNDFSAFLIKFNMVEGASELDGVARWIDDENGSHPFSWEFAAQIASYQPKISIVQLTDKSGAIWAIDLNNELFYTPLTNGKQLVQIKGKSYLAVPQPGKLGLFLLKNTIQSTSNFAPLKPFSSAMSIQEEVPELYKDFQMEESLWLAKNEMILLLAPLLSQKPIGAMKIDGEHGIAMLTDEVFLTTSILASNTDKPQLFVKKPENDLNIGKSVVVEAGTVGLGFSISAMIQRIAMIAQKPVIATKEGSFSIGFMPDGKNFDPTTLPQGYVPFQIDLNLFKLSILTPAAQANAFSQFLVQLSAQITETTGLILVSAALGTLVLALILLGRISKRITDPIDVLTKASVQLGEGKYDQLTFPKLGNREDEVATLTHSFENMAGALKDRDKIHAVLNKVVSKEISDEILKKVLSSAERRRRLLYFSAIFGGLLIYLKSCSRARSSRCSTNT